MSNISLVIEREYMTRVRTKIFWIGTLLAPIALSLSFLVPVLVGIYGASTKTVWVLDESGKYAEAFKNVGEGTKRLKFVPKVGTTASLKEALKREDTIDGLIVVPASFAQSNPKGAALYGETALGPTYVEIIEDRLAEQLRSQRLSSAGLSQSLIDSMDVKVALTTFNIAEGKDKKSSSGAASLMGLMGGLLMYFFIFIYGGQVMRGVVEEKANRIVEVIITSIKPIELMLGKIIGIALVGLTQFMLWIVLTAAFSTILGLVFGSDKIAQGAAAQGGVGGGPSAGASTSGMERAMDALGTINVPMYVTLFLLFFLGGYLLYAALFAAIGSAVDNEQDSQSLTLPVSLPIFIGMAIAQVAAQDPNSPVAFWFSIFPLTSPIVMIARLAYKDPMLDWEVALSLGLLVLGFFGTTWLAAKVYRVGVLMYGKKPTFKEIGKWLFYKS